MRVAIYTICRDEEKHVARFMRSTAGADGVFALDTGSADGTAAALQSAGAIVKVYPMNPFRFDVARNLALHMVPGDYEACVVLDLDETLLPGWREKLEAVWRPGKTTSAATQVICSRDDLGRPDAVYFGKRIHSRSGWSWRYPAHVLVTPFIPDVPAAWPDPSAAAAIEHLPDATKSRADRLGLLELGARENPHNARCSHYLGREYFFRNMLLEAEAELRRSIQLTEAGWAGDRAASMRYLGWIANRRNRDNEAIAWFLRECAEMPWHREPWVDLANAYHKAGNAAGCWFAARQALAIKERPADGITYGYAWGELPWDLAAVSAWRLGMKTEALAAAQQAAALNPADRRLQANVEKMRAA